MILAALLSLFPALLPSAQADGITDGPGKMHGNVGLRTELFFASDQLIESQTTVGNRDLSLFRTELYGEFAPLSILSIAFSVPYLQQSILFSNSSEMTFSPKLSTGSYLNANAIEDLERKGAGLGGARLGLYLYPFHDRLWESRADRGAWKIGLFYRFASSTHFFSTNEQGDRGAGPGGSALEWYSAFSMPSRVGSPYIEMQGELAGTWQGTIRDDLGSSLIDQATIRPPSKLSLRIGNELTLWEDTAFAHFAELDLFGRVNYESWADVPTGVLLPNVLNSYSDLVSNRSERLQIGGGLGTNLQYDSYYHGRFAFEAGYMSPHHIDHLYPVSTNGGLFWSLLFEFRFRYRTTAT